MGQKLKIDNDCYGEGIKMYQKGTIEIEPGLTILVGCNGAGKTTLLKQIYKKIQDKNIPCVMYDNLRDGGVMARSKAVGCGNIAFLSQSFCSSEGENICLNMQVFSNMIYKMFKENPNDQEYWIFADAIDSGLSINNIANLKSGLFEEVLNIHKNKTVYIMVSANSYEMARTQNCFDVISGRYVSIKSYEKYRNVILKSEEKKAQRYNR